jgi:hypothetical protein
MAPTDVTVDRPFAASTVLTDEGGGRFTAELGTLFSIGGKAHGGLLMVLLTKAALARLNAEHGGDTELDPVVVGTEFLRKETADPVVRGWMRPRGEDPDPLFALLAGDALPPTVFNRGGGRGWAPTVQLTAMLRARPAPGWLALESRSQMIAGAWFDEDCTVRDATGRVVCQARQLALSPLPRK